MRLERLGRELGPDNEAVGCWIARGDAKGEGIAERPMQFRHDIEVHAIDAHDERQRHEDGGNENRQSSPQTVLMWSTGIGGISSIYIE